MKKIKMPLILLGVMLLVLGLFSAARADTLALNFTMWIDHNDTLTINTETGGVQWRYNGQYAPVGLWDGRTLEAQVPTVITVTHNGSLLNTYNWKQWTVMPTYWVVTDSSILSMGELSLLTGATINSVLEEVIQARNSMTFGGSNTIPTINCYDSAGGASTYEARITFDYTAASPVPLPSAFFLLAPGLAGLMAIRRKRVK